MKAALRTARLAALLAAPAQAKPTDGRAEALIAATAFGLYEGIALSILLDEYDLLPGSGFEAELTSAFLLTGLTTAGSFLVADAVIDTYGVNEGQARIVNSSFIWALMNGTALSIGADFGSEEALWTSLVSGWTGQGLGILLAANVDRTPGQVGLMNTIATWSGAETALIMGAFELRPDSTFFTVPTLAADIGLLAGSYIASKVRISDSRARMLDLGALAGGLAAPAALFMLWGPEENLQNWYLGAVAIGIPAGIALSWHLTRDWDDGAELGEASAAALMVPLMLGRW